MTIRVQVFALHQVLRPASSVFIENGVMKGKYETNTKTHHRLKTIANTLREIRFSEGKLQDELTVWGATRRQIQRGEQGFNLTLISLFNLLDCYGYRLDEFFEGME